MKPVSGEDISKASEVFGAVNWQLSSPQEIRFGKHGSVAFNREEQTYFDFDAWVGGHIDHLLPDVTPAPNCISLVIEKYDYVDESGVLLHQQRRYEPKNSDRVRLTDTADGSKARVPRWGSARAVLPARSYGCR